MRPSVTAQTSAMERPRERDHDHVSASDRLRSRLSGAGAPGGLAELIAGQSSRRRGSMNNASQVSLSSNTPTAGGGSQVGSPRVAKTGWSRRPKVTFPSSHSTTTLHAPQAVTSATSLKPRPSRVSLRSAMKQSTRPPIPPPPSDTAIGPSLASTGESVGDGHHDAIIPTPTPRRLSFRPPPPEQRSQLPQQHASSSGIWNAPSHPPSHVPPHPPAHPPAHHPARQDHRVIEQEHGSQPRTRRLSVRSHMSPPDRTRDLHTSYYQHQDPHESDSEYTDSNLSDDTHATTAESNLTINEPKRRPNRKVLAPNPPRTIASSSRHTSAHHHSTSRTALDSGRTTDARTVLSRTAPTSRSAAPSNMTTEALKSPSEGRRSLHIEVLAPPAPKESEESIRQREEETRKRQRIEAELRDKIAHLEQQLKWEAEAREQDRLALAVPKERLDGALERLSVLNAEREKEREKTGAKLGRVGAQLEKVGSQLEQAERDRDLERGRGEELQVQYEKQVKALSEARETLAQQSKALEERCLSLTCTEMERDSLQGVKTELEAKCAQLEQEIGDVRAARSQSEIVTIEKLAASEMVREVLQLKVDGMVAEIATKNMAIEDLTKERDSLKEETEKSAVLITTLTDEKKAVEEEKQKAEEKVTSLEEEITKLKANIEGLAGEKSALETKVTSLEEEATALKAKTEELEKASGEKDTQIVDLTKETDELKEEISSVNTAKEEKEKELEEANGQLASAKEEAEKEASELKEKLAAAESEMAKIQEELKELQAKTPEDYTVAIAAAAALGKEKDELTQKVADLQAEADKVAALATEKANLEATKTDLEGEKATLEAANAALATEKSTLQSEANQVPLLRGEAAALTAQLSAASQAAAEARTAQQNAAAEAARLQMHVNQLRVKLAAESKSTRKRRSESVSGASMKSTKKPEDGFFFVRTTQDRGRMQVMKKSDLRTSRSSSRTGD